MKDLDFNSDEFSDITARDDRYAGGAYVLLADVVGYLGKDGRHFHAEDILDEFKETALDHFGPMTYTVLTEWGVKCTEDIGEMMFNLVESKRFRRDEGVDTQESFAGGYDFAEAFLGPYEP